ncbi:hypothetical protein [Paraglaciecola polaris]|uniref:Uncharacterized protein n=1 Tax=Paraglaciecola polaris LMG 21857 TaxID=1129793 RepID=K7A0A6_9ALTE|nr:hypothetical protein [Paraglaciecola polaris]GAC34388.1 hypothetical protein GPLA_3499 [Paraglaciecola polaris LMG 21857]
MNTLICYRMNERSKNTEGIFAKIIRQAIVFEALGHDARLIYMSLINITLSTLQPIEVHNQFSVSFWNKSVLSELIWS